MRFKNPLEKKLIAVIEPSVRKGFGLNEKFYGNAAAGSASARIAKTKEDGDLKDGEYQEISELIGQIERAFTNG